MYERKDQVKKFLRYMNSRHPNIQFTCKEESNNKFSFLDVSMTRMKNKLVTSLYRKKTFSGAYMSHNSLLLKYKKGLIHILLFRALNICADYNTLHNEVQYSKLKWQKNSSPFFFIDSFIKRFLDKLFIIRKTSDSVSDKKEIFIFLELLGKIPFQSKKQLTKIFRTCKKNLKVNAIFKSSNRIRNAFRFKVKISTFMNSKLIYKFKCNICNDVYVGETKRHLLVRQCKHLGKSIVTEKPSKYNKKYATAIKKHCHENNHEADSSCFTLIDSASNNFHLKLKLSLLMLKLKPSLNVAKESMPLMPYYLITMHKL